MTIRLNLDRTESLPSGLRFSATDGVLLAPSSRLQLDPGQPRLVVTPEDLAELRADIDAWREAGHGLLGSGIMEPLKCRWEPGSVNANGSVKKNARLLVWDGGRKWRVTHEDYEWLPIILDDLDSKKARSAALRTSIHNKSHTPIEQGHAFAAEMEEEGLSYRAMAEKYSVNKSYIENRVNLLKCPPDVQKFAADNPALMSHALAMRDVTDKSLRGTLMELARHKASVAEIKEVIAEESEQRRQAQETRRAPDRETTSRTATHARTGGGNVSRGREVKGHSAAECRREAEAALNQAATSLETARQWIELLGEKDHQRLSGKFAFSLRRRLKEVFPEIP